MRILVQTNSGYFYPLWIEFLRKFGAEPVQLDLPGGDTIPVPDSYSGLMWHLSMEPSILQTAEPFLSPIEFIHGKKVFPNYTTRWHFENKFSQKYLLDSLGARTPETHCFWSRESAMEWISSLGKGSFPVVHKKGRGAGSVNVALVETAHHAEKIVLDAFSPRGTWHQNGYLPTAGRTGSRKLKTLLFNQLVRAGDATVHVLTGRMPHLPKKYWMPEKDCVLFQEFLPGNRFDTRITIIGNRAFGFRRWNRPDDFRASGGGDLDHSIDGIDRKCIEIAFQVSEKAGFQSMAYDFLSDSAGEPVICEISFGYQNLAVHNCPGHWDGNLNWVEGQMWPEEAHVRDFLAEF